MFGLGGMEIVIILGAALILIGPKKLPELARGLGKGLKEFQNAAKGISSSISDPIKKTTEDIKKDLPSWNEQFKDDPPHEEREETSKAESAASIDQIKPKEK